MAWTTRTIEPAIPGTSHVRGWLDGRTLLVASEGSASVRVGETGSQPPGLYRLDLDTGQASLLLGGASDAALSPDGQSIVAAFPQENAAALVLLDADGSGVQPLNVAGSLPSWSPDSQWILFRQEEAGNSFLSMIHPDGTGLRENVTLSGPRQPVWSPDRVHFLTQGGSGDGSSSWFYLTSLVDGRTDLIALPNFNGLGNWSLLSWASSGQIFLTGNGAT